MDFLRVMPELSLAGDSLRKGAFTAFFVEVFRPRPPFAQISAFGGRAQDLQSALDNAVARPRTPVESVAAYIDEAGCFVV